MGSLVLYIKGKLRHLAERRVRRILVRDRRVDDKPPSQVVSDIFTGRKPRKRLTE